MATKKTTKTRKRKAASKPSAKAKGSTKRPDKPKRSGVLDAAATVLASAGKPMRCGEMIEAITKRGLWSTKGKTPAATLYSAIFREIQKGSDARFRKADRGRFQIRKGA